MQIKLFSLPWVWHRKRSCILSGSEPTMTWLLDLDLGFKAFELFRTLYILKKKKRLLPWKCILSPKQAQGMISFGITWIFIFDLGRRFLPKKYGGLKPRESNVVFISFSQMIIHLQKSLTMCNWKHTCLFTKERPCSYCAQLQVLGPLCLMLKACSF